MDAATFNNAHALDLLAHICALMGVAAAAAFDDDHVEFVRTFQRRMGLPDDGKLGATTRLYLEEELLQRPSVALWPDELTPEAKFAHYAAICRRCGCDPAGQKVLLGLRGVRLRGYSTHVVRSWPRYDDAFVFLNDVGGAGEVVEFAGATHPYQRYSASSPDQDGDGLGDVAMIRPGLYEVRRQPGGFRKRPALVVRTKGGSGLVPAVRDVNHNGLFSPEELAAALSHSGAWSTKQDGAIATGILFHPGFDTTHGDSAKRFSSIGCQTAPLPCIEILWESERFDYLLVRAIDVVAAIA